MTLNGIFSSVVITVGVWLCRVIRGHTFIWRFGTLSRESLHQFSPGHCINLSLKWSRLDADSKLNILFISQILCIMFVSVNLDYTIYGV